VPGSGECGDEHPGSGATELVVKVRTFGKKGITTTVKLFTVLTQITCC
jgi:hypothetical protein